MSKNSFPLKKKKKNEINATYRKIRKEMGGRLRRKE